MAELLPKKCRFTYTVLISQLRLFVYKELFGSAHLMFCFIYRKDFTETRGIAPLGKKDYF
jgi:hypothetical protein